jgi:signal transduction histidine kinase
MQRMISGLLDINRLESGQQIAVKQPFDISDVINEAMDTIQPMAAGKSITIRYDLQQPLSQVMIDEDMVRRVLVNLLENATKFSPAGSVVMIGAREKEDKVFVWVDDQGSGIPEKAQERIFDKFVQLHGNNTYKGLGLGLAFCKLAVQAHGGTIWVENLPEGGSRFIFTLPV